ncbi:MAG TPA: prepilin peptidase [Deltaproteobacteria bacterium]|nr:prepilin peptidase [Deltaproteobacteria bacterium]
MPAMQILLVLYVGLFGVLLGSFLGMAAVRIPARESIISPRSRCPQCRRTLAWYENIPLFSYLFLRGKCRSCGAKISFHYFFMEALTCILTLSAFFQLKPWPRFLAYLLLFLAPLLLLAVIDWRELVLPDVITLPGIAAGFLLHWLDGKYFQPRLLPLSTADLLLQSLVGALAGAITLSLIAWLYFKLRHREGMGVGDVKLAAMLGAVFGWKAIFFIFLLASVLGILLGLFWILLRGRSVRALLPFGTCLAAASLLYLFYGEPLLHAYIKFINNLI